MTVRNSRAIPTLLSALLACSGSFAHAAPARRAAKAPVLARASRPASARPRVLVLDFDGTISNLAKESAPFQKKYPRLFAERTGIGNRQLKALWKEATAKVAPNMKEGWQTWTESVRPDHTLPAREEKRVIVAAAQSDPYLFDKAVATQAFNLARERHLLDKKKLEDAGYSATDPQKLLESVFHDSYGGEVAFREGAKRSAAFLTRARGLYDRVFIVTNSAPDAVKAKLKVLAQQTGKPALARIPVFGDASKHIVTPDWSHYLHVRMPATFRVAGVDRPIQLQRGRYAALLFDRLKLQPSQITVVGDIPELDLYMPLRAGAAGALQLANRYSLPQDAAYLKSQPHGAVAHTYKEALGVLGEWSKNL